MRCPTILGIVVLNFLLLHLAPGDAADVLAGEAGSATPEYMAQLRQKFGLDQPLYVQLVVYLEARRSRSISATRSATACR